MSSCPPGYVGVVANNGNFICYDPLNPQGGPSLLKGAIDSGLVPGMTPPPPAKTGALGVLDNAWSWVKDNPLLIAGVVAGGLVVWKVRSGR